MCNIQHVSKIRRSCSFSQALSFSLLACLSHSTISMPSSDGSNKLHTDLFVFLSCQWPKLKSKGFFIFYIESEQSNSLWTFCRVHDTSDVDTWMMSKNQCSCEHIYGSLYTAMCNAKKVLLFFFFHGDLDWKWQCRAEKLRIILCNAAQSYFRK